MIDEKLFQKISQRIDAYRDGMIELQTALCAHPAVGPENGGDGELLKAHFNSNTKPCLLAGTGQCPFSYYLYSAR